MFLEMSRDQKKQLENEVINSRTRLKLTRYIRSLCNRNEKGYLRLIIQNHFINIARSVLNLPTYVLEAEDEDYYYPVEYAWHTGEMELIFKRPDTIELIEILADYINNNMVDHKMINSILEEDGLSFRFNIIGEDIIIKILSITDLEEEKPSGIHQNIRYLINRMDNAYETGDYPLVVHTSGSIFETMAKDIIGLSSINNMSLGSFFERYKKDSRLPETFLEFIKSIYERRNTEPLAGHGSLSVPSVSQEQATIIREMTKAFIKIENVFRKENLILK